MTARNRVLQAAVFEASDARAASAARVVPTDAELLRVGTTIIGYSTPPRPTHSRLRPKDEIEMLARHRRKALRALVHFRKRTSALLSLPGWTAAAADIAAGIYGASMTVGQVEAVLVWIGIEPDLTTLAVSAEKARRDRQMPGFRLAPAAVVGALISLSSAEATWIRSSLRLKRLAIKAVDHNQARKAVNAETARLRRAQRARPRNSQEAKQPWKAIGKSRSWWFAHKNELDRKASALPTIRARTTKTVQSLGKDDAFQSRNPPWFDAVAPLSGKDDENSPIADSADEVEE